MARIHVLVVVAFVAQGVLARDPYLGVFLGHLSGTHNLDGSVYAASDDSLHLVTFSYDGAGPDAHFIVGTTDEPTPKGIIVPNEKGSFAKLEGYDKRDIIITLPDGKKIKDFKYFGVYCKKASVSFGYIMIQPDFKAPQAATVGELKGMSTMVTSGPVTLIDSMTLMIENFNYDGNTSDASFLVGTGMNITEVGATKLPDENLSNAPLKQYKNKNITIKLPSGAWADYDWLSVYSIGQAQDLANVMFGDHPKSIPLHFTKVHPSKSGATTTLKPDDLKPPASRAQQKPYYGKKLGDLSSSMSGLSGILYAATGNDLVLEDFTYDGRAPGAFFLVGTSSAPSKDGTVLANEAGSTGKLPAYNMNTIVLKLPPNTDINHFRWFSVYSKDDEMSLGDIAIPTNFDYPKERVIGSSLNGAHRTHVGEVVLKDMKTLFLKDFSYDGSAPDAFFLCGKGNPNPQGTKVPNEKGSVTVLRGYSHEDITLTLPGKLTMFDIDWFAVYCISYTEIFIRVTIPRNPNIPPQVALLEAEIQDQHMDVETDFENCETILPNKLQVAWKVEGDLIKFDLRTILMPKQWAAFGISGDKDNNLMVGGDVAVVYLDEAPNKVKLEDYYLESKAQCSDKGGVCPDVKSPIKKGTDDLTMISSKYENGVLRVVYSRPLATTDPLDKTITPAGETTVIAAQGPLQDGVVLYHTMYWTKSKTTLTLSRQAQKNCPPLTASPPRKAAKDESQFGGRHILRSEGVTTFTARIGPTGGSKGYSKITGMAGWGIAWWINDELIPVLYVERGKTYTFKVEGGHDDSNSARYHPFYITDSKRGGGSKEEPAALRKKGNLLLAGITMGADGKPDVSKAVGRYCEWEHKSIDQSEQSKTFEEFKKTLKLECEPDGKPGEFTWTPDKDTPDVVYYQCFTHYFLGWKIMVKNKGDVDKPEPTVPDDVHPIKPNGASASISSLLVTSLLACVTLRLSSQLVCHQ